MAEQPASGHSRWRSLLKRHTVKTFSELQTYALGLVPMTLAVWLDLTVLGAQHHFQYEWLIILKGRTASFPGGTFARGSGCPLRLSSNKHGRSNGQFLHCFTVVQQLIDEYNLGDKRFSMFSSSLLDTICRIQSKALCGALVVVSQNLELATSGPLISTEPVVGAKQLHPH